MAEHEFLIRGGNTPLPGSVGLELIQVALDPLVADYLPFAGFPPDQQDCPNLISHGPGGRDVPPPEPSCLPDPEALIAHYQDVQGQVVPFPLAPFVLSLIY